jgi:hypothetical protein
VGRRALCVSVDARQYRLQCGVFLDVSPGQDRKLQWEMSPVVVVGNAPRRHLQACGPSSPPVPELTWPRTLRRSRQRIGRRADGVHERSGSAVGLLELHARNPVDGSDRLQHRDVSEPLSPAVVPEQDTSDMVATGPRFETGIDVIPAPSIRVHPRPRRCSAGSRTLIVRSPVLRPHARPRALRRFPETTVNGELRAATGASRRSSRARRRSCGRRCAT